jgi:hypothetical protein
MGISAARRRLFIGAFCFFALARLIFAVGLPVLGDEAYYISWGRELRALYYDQPPMIGWWLWALQRISSHPLVLRLPVVLIPTLLGVWAIRRLQSSERAWTGALLACCSVFVTVPMLMTTDVPLVLFTVLAVASIAAAIDSGKVRWFAAAGVCIGLGFLSKYFVVLLIPAYLIHALVFGAHRRRALRGAVVILAAAAPFFAFHLWANWQECWANFIFNFSSRHLGESRGKATLLEYLAHQVALLSPLLLIPVVRSHKELRRAMKRPVLAWLALSFAVPVLAFGYSAIRHAQGLHWMISFYPGLFFLIAFALPMERLRFWTRLQVGLSAGLVLSALLVLVVPSEWMPDEYRIVREIQRARELPGLREALAPALEAAPPGAPLFAESYSNAATLSYHLGRPVRQFGNLGKFGRNDDLLFDLTPHAGGDLVYITRGQKPLRRVERFFRSIESSSVRSGRTRYRVSVLKGFDLEAYRATVLERLQKTYYFEPAWVPAGSCSFRRFYFGGS